MKNIGRVFVLIALALTVTACGSGPGALEGTWQMSGPMPMIITFREGETESMGMIEKVSYKTEGNDILVTYLDGLAKGTTIRYTLTGKDTARMGPITLRRIR